MNRIQKEANSAKQALVKKENTGSWRYDGGKRDLRLDIMRGLAVFVMVVDHTGGDNSWLYTLTGHGNFLISAAEPFVFISGLVMGIVYSAIVIRDGFRRTYRKALKRAGMLYALDVALSLSLAALSLQLNLPWAPHWGKEGLAGFVLGLVTLHRTYYLTNVMLLYTLLVTVAVPVIALLSKRRAWSTALVLAGSWGLWLAWQIWPGQIEIPWRISDNTIFHFTSWQVLFVTALVVGFHWRGISDRMRALTRIALTVMLGVSGALVACSIGLYLWSQSPQAGSVELLIAQLFEKADMRIGRMAVFAVFAVFVFTLLTIAWVPARRILGWLLLPLGQNALTAYVLHVFYVSLSAAVLAKPLAGVAGLPVTSTAVEVFGIMLIWATILLLDPLGVRVRAIRERCTAFVRTAWSEASTPKSGRGLRAALPGRAYLAAAIVIMALVVVGLFSLRGPVNRTLKALNEEGKNTVVMVPTVTVIFPGSGTSTKSPGVAEARAVVPQATQTPVSSALGVAGAPASAATATVQVDLPAGAQWRNFNSKALGRTMPYIVYLPPGYKENTASRFPVLYMLHGVGDGSSGLNTEWIRYGLVGWGDQLMRAGLIKPFIIVIPQGEQSYWVDQANGGPQWGTYVARDLVSEIDTNFRTLANGNDRAVGGISMGGHAALQLSMNFPDVFGIAGADSPSLHSFDDAPSFFGDEAYFDAHDPSYLFQAHPAVARTLKLWIDVGQQDAWLPIISNLHQQLVNEGIPHEWHVFSGDILTGGHTGEYWSTHIPDYLRFYSSAFN